MHATDRTHPGVKNAIKMLRCNLNWKFWAVADVETLLKYGRLLRGCSVVWWFVRFWHGMVGLQMRLTWRPAWPRLALSTIIQVFPKRTSTQLWGVCGKEPDNIDMYMGHKAAVEAELSSYYVHIFNKFFKTRWKWKRVLFHLSYFRQTSLPCHDPTPKPINSIVLLIVLSFWLLLLPQPHWRSLFMIVMECVYNDLRDGIRVKSNRVSGETLWLVIISNSIRWPKKKLVMWFSEETLMILRLSTIMFHISIFLSSSRNLFVSGSR